MTNAPKWGSWLDGRQLAVECKACKCVYTPAERSLYSGKMIGGIPRVCKNCARDKAEAKRKALPLNPTLVEAVKAHALDNYNKGGWDYVVETYEDKEIWEEIAGAKTPEAAIRKMKKIVNLLHERREDVQSTAW